MAKIDEIIRDMEQLLSGSDHSNSPRGRQLAEIYSEICRDVNDSLAECRSLFRMGAYAEARKLNARAVPVLTDRYRLLNFSKRADWIRLCNLYGWSVPPELDSETAEQLLSEDDQELELTITELQDQWRRIIRDGSLREKLILARKIYALDPSDIWRSNLLNVERPWVNMLKMEADEALADERAKDLADLYNELISPDLLQKIPPASLSKYQDLLNRYSREQIEQQKHTLLDEIGSLYAAMLLDELEDALSRWSALESNPLFSCTREEQIQIDDARTFFLEQQADINKKERFKSLQNQLEQLLNDEADPKEIDHVYHSLQQLDCPIKPLLEERMHDLYAKLELEAKRRHVRRCVYWGVSVLLLAAVIFTTIFLVQREREFRRDSAKIRELIDNNQYEAALKYCSRIAQERPHIAERPAIEALRKESEEKLAEIQKSGEIFDNLCNDLESKYLNKERVLDPVVSELFDELEKRAQSLSEEKRARQITLLKKYEDLKKSIYQEFEIAFIKDVKAMEMKWAEFFSTLSEFTESEKKCIELKTESMKLLGTYQARISKELYDEWKKKFEENASQYDEIRKRDREARARMRTLSYPESLEEYADALKQAEINAGKVQEAFQKAIAQFPDATTLNLAYGHESNLVKVMDQYPQDPYCRDIKRKVSHPEHDAQFTEERKRRLGKLQKETLEDHYKVSELVLYFGAIPYHFYLNDAKNDIYLETDWDETVWRALRLSFVVANNKLKADIVFQVADSAKEVYAKHGVMIVNGKKILFPLNREHKSETSQTMDKNRNLKLQVMPGQKFDHLPNMLILPDKMVLKDTSGLKLAAHYTVLQKQLSCLGANPDSHKILSAIYNVAQDRTITNIYAKVHLLKQLYSLLPVSKLPHYSKLLNELSVLLDHYTDNPEKQRWQDPTATHENQRDVTTFHNKLAALNLKEKISALILNEFLLKRAVKYYPVASGVLFCEEGRWILRPFKLHQKALQLECDVFILSGSTDQKNCVRFSPIRFIAGVPEAELPDVIKGKLFNGQLVYLNRNLVSWQKEFQGAALDLKNLGFSVPADTGNIVWPEIWPLNLRNIQELMQ